jgi:hypothetical protein
MRMGNDGKPHVPVQPCRRHPRRHLDRPAGRRALRRQADLLDPDRAPLDRCDGNGRSMCAPRAGTTPASASAPCRSARPWSPARSPTIICAIAARPVGPLSARSGRFSANCEIVSPMPYDQKSVVDAIRAFEAGEIVVVTDDDGRENEGDLIVAAVHCTPEKMAFIVRHTSGIVCAPMPREEAKRLNLTAMVAERRAARDRLHGVGRLQARHHDGHFRRRPDADGAQPRQPQCRRQRLRAARPHLPAGRARRRRADALRPYGSRRRSLQACRTAADRRDLRTRQ